LTLAVYPVQKGVSQLDYVKTCVQTIHDLGIGITVLCLNRRFCSIALFSYLQQEEIPYIVPIKKQGKDLKMLLHGRKYR
jgi:putative transposase